MGAFLKDVVTEVTPEQSVKASPVVANPATVPKKSRFLKEIQPNIQIQQPIQKESLLKSAQAPFTEIRRGLHQGNEFFYNQLNSVTKLMEMVGIPRSGMFGQIAEEQKAAAEGIPETSMNNGLSKVYNFIGGAVPYVASFGLAGASLGASGISGVLGKTITGKALTPAAEFAVVEALDEFNKDPNLKSLVQGAKSGAEVGMLFPIASKGLSLLKNFGKASAEAWIKFTTGDAQLAKDFVENPGKYNLNPFNRVKNKTEIQIEHDTARLNLDNKYKAEKDAFNEQNRRKAFLLEDSVKNSENALKDSLTFTRDSLKESNKMNLAEATEKSKEAIKSSNQSLQASAVSIYDDTLIKYNQVRKEAGERVGVAVKNIVEKDPTASISSGIVDKRVNSVIGELNPFKVKTGKKGDVFTGRTAAASQTEAKLFTAIEKEYRAMAKEGNVSIEYLQNLKKDLQVRADDAFTAERNEIGKFYQELSNAVNPAKIVADNPNLTKGLEELSEANKNFANLVPKHEEAIKQYFTKDAQGKPIPDVDKAIRAIRGQDIVTLRQMRKADLALPAEDRMLPKLMKFVTEADKTIDTQLAMVSNLKRKADQELMEFNKRAGAELKSLQQANKTEKNQVIFEKRQQLIAEKNAFIDKQNREYAASIAGLKETERFYQDQIKLRSVRAEGGSAKLVQSVSAFGGILPSLTGRFSVPAIMGGLGGIAGSSPMVAASTIKNIGRPSANAINTLRSILERTNIKRALAGGILK